MKKVICTFVLCIISNICFSQERINREKVHFSAESGVIKQAIGWAYNEVLGEWIAYKNCVCSNKQFQTLLDSSSYQALLSQSLSHFISIQTKTISYKGHKYYILVHSYWGDYKSRKIIRYYLLDKKGYYNLFKLTNNPKIITGYSLSPSYNVPIEDYIIYFINKYYIEQRDGSFYSEIRYDRKSDIVTIYKATNGKIRFLFPQKYFNNSIRDGYFEITENEWRKLIIQEKPSVSELESAYAILRVKPTDNNETIKKAYHELAKTYHPDRVYHLGEEYRKKAEKQFKRISEAYNVIKKARNL